MRKCACALACACVLENTRQGLFFFLLEILAVVWKGVLDYASLCLPVVSFGLHTKAKTFRSRPSIISTKIVRCGCGTSEAAE